MPTTEQPPILPPQTPTATIATENPQLLMTVKGGASWMFWVAGLSLINSVISYSGYDWQFAMGLGITMVLDGLAAAFKSTFATIFAGCVNAAILLALVGLGVLAGRRAVWAFVLGIGILGLDTALLFAVAGTEAFFGIALHAWAIYAMFGGMNAAKALRRAG